MNKESMCVHSGAERAASGGLVTAIQPSTAYAYLDAEEQVYPRYFNTPNQQAVIRKLCDLEQAEAGVLFSSGMAAISTTLLALLQPGDHAVLLEGLYGGTHTFVTDQFDRLGIGYTFAGQDPDRLLAACTEHTRLLYVESPTNPLLTIVDLQAVAALAAPRGLRTVIDNTFASPINQNPIPLGFDVVIHSGTKYLGGHSDIACGAVLTSAAYAARIRQVAMHYGGSLNATSCALLERSLKTLSLRVARQNENAVQIAAYLTDHPAVKQVYHPSLPSHPGHAVASRQMRGFGGMLSFDLERPSMAETVLRRLTMITPALSLGGVESTICMPATTSHRKMPPADQQRLGIGAGLLRLSMGIEHADDLRADLEQALAL